MKSMISGVLICFLWSPQDCIPDVGFRVWDRRATLMSPYSGALLDYSHAPFCKAISWHMRNQQTAITESSLATQLAGIDEFCTYIHTYRQTCVYIHSHQPLRKHTLAGSTHLDVATAQAWSS